MTEAIVKRDNIDMAMMERVVVGGDLSKLEPAQRLSYYNSVCQSVGLNPLTRPFDYITLNGKMTLYAKKDATDQLRQLKGVSISKPDIQFVDDVVIVAVSASDASGRTDSDLGIVTIGNAKGDAKANAIMKAITKAKRRVTLSIAGLGWLDETEVETIRDARMVVVDDDGEIIETPQKPVERTQGAQPSNRATKNGNAPQRSSVQPTMETGNTLKFGNRIYAIVNGGDSGESLWTDDFRYAKGEPPHHNGTVNGVRMMVLGDRDAGVPADLPGQVMQWWRDVRPTGDDLNFALGDVPEVNPNGNDAMWEEMAQEARDNEAADKKAKQPFAWPTNEEALELCAGTVNSPDLGERCHKMVQYFVGLNEGSSNAMTDKQYQFLAGLLDKRYKATGAHNAILSALIGGVVDGEHVPGYNVKELIDWLKDDKANAQKLAILDELVSFVMADLA